MSVGKSCLVVVLCFGLVEHVFSAYLPQFRKYVNPNDPFAYKVLDGLGVPKEEGKLRSHPVINDISVAGPYELDSNRYILVINFSADRLDYDIDPHFSMKDTPDTKLNVLKMIDPKVLASLAGGGLG